MIRRLAAASGIVLMTALAGCTSTVALEPAEAANDPLCAEVMVRLPDRIAGEGRRWTDAQATAAWGDPTAIIMRCGLEPPGPTAQLQCVSVAGTDWLVDDSDYPRLRLTSYGRTPAVQLYVDRESADPTPVMQQLAQAVAPIPQESACVAPDTPDT